MAVLEANVVRCDRLFPSGSYGFSGGIIQMASMTNSTPASQAISANTIADLPWSISITPRDIGNKMLIYSRWCGEMDDTWNTTFFLKRNSTYIGNTHTDGVKNAGTAVPVMSYAAAASNNASTPEACQFWYTDSPATVSTVTYTPALRCFTAHTMYHNRTFTDTNATNYERLISGMLILEISA